jgi:hypothetical protein
MEIFSIPVIFTGNSEQRKLHVVGAFFVGGGVPVGESYELAAPELEIRNICKIRVQRKSFNFAPF